MKEIKTPFGIVKISNKEKIFQETVDIIKKTVNNADDLVRIALTGGSTPIAFYRWIAIEAKFLREWRHKIYWYTSDERYVPLYDDQSNFGTADKYFLQLMGIEQKYKFPWNTEINPKDCAADYNSKVLGKCFDICFLGMGDDCHTASIFPGSPILKDKTEAYFTSVDVPEKGTRLTITPYGLSHCDKIIVTVMGANKRHALKEVFNGEFNPEQKPIQLLKSLADKVIWLVEEEAAADLHFEKAQQA